jgi:large subunit ribosomal protein L3e
MNKKIYRIGKGTRGGCNNNASTNQDLTDKVITPMGGFPHYGVVRDDFVMVKGGIVGPKKKVVMLRRPIFPQTKRSHLE